MVQRQVVTELFRNGMPCSQIDKALSLPKGTARIYVTQWWLDDKLSKDSAGWVKRGKQ